MEYKEGEGRWRVSDKPKCIKRRCAFLTVQGVNY